MKTITLSALLLCLSTAVFAADSSQGILEVHEPWVREAPPVVKVLAGYFTLHNHTDKTHTVLSVSSPQFNRVEIHHTQLKNDTARMLPVPKIKISPLGKVVFEPGGLHLMLIKPEKIYRSGDNIHLTLHLSDKSTFDFTAPVKKSHGMEDHSSHNMGQNSHDMNHEPLDENNSNNKHYH